AAQPDPVAAIVAESAALLARHADHPLAPRVDTARHALLDYRDRVARLAGDTRHLFADETPVIANTEVNSGNFLVPEGGSAASCGDLAAPCGAWLVDWEKAVVTTRYQDLGHFLASSTTLWKTDFTFDAATRAAFLEDYREALRHAGQPVPDAEECAAKADVMVRAVLLRGLSWCLMAWHEYAGGGRALAHADTFRTIERYLGNIAWFLR
ncbi:aminoglycoside phosphotransferase family protein, partial [Desulfovibrio sp. XJ01]|nr:aminoglycoside phosphotransferase family protein [Nitratidesulfovibrio liaohensis]